MWKVFLLALSLTLLPGCGDKDPTTAGAPSVVATDLGGLQQAILAKRGKALLLNFWALWCPPCVAELPDLQATADAFAGKPVEVVTVSYDLMMPDMTREQAVADVKAYLAKKGFRFPVWVFDGDDYDGINAHFGLPGDIPVTLAINARGDIVERHEGKADQAQFTAMVERALRD